MCECREYSVSVGGACVSAGSTVGVWGYMCECGGTCMGIMLSIV